MPKQPDIDHGLSEEQLRELWAHVIPVRHSNHSTSCALNTAPAAAASPNCTCGGKLFAFQERVAANLGAL